MKTKTQSLAHVLLLALLLLPGVACGMINAFTYQGRLTDGGNPANGLYDLTFALFDSASNPTGQQGSTVTHTAVNVSGGLFTVVLDFDAGVFDGNDRWLEIAGRTNNVGSFGTLTPRQPITPTAYAIFTANAQSAVTATTATSAGTASSFSGSLAGDVTGTQGATVVANVGGQSAADVASGAAAANAATDANTPSAIVKRDGSGNFSAGTITANLTGNVTGNATTANNFSGSLAGNVTGTQGATVVATVGGQSAANVASGASAANAALSANSADTIVKRDPLGNFSAGTVTAALNGNATTATTANNFSGSLAGDVTGTQGATVVASVGGQSAANVASGASAANAATSANTVNTIVKRDTSGNFTAGTVTATTFQFPSPQSFVHQMTANSFVPDHPGEGYDRGAGLISPSGDTSLQFLASVHLPHGAVVTRLVAVFSDLSATENFTDIDARLEYFTTSSFTAVTMAEIANEVTLLAFDGGRVEFDDATILGATINNNTRAYMLVVNFSVNTATSNTRFYGVRIEYTLDTLSP